MPQDRWNGRDVGFVTVQVAPAQRSSEHANEALTRGQLRPARWRNSASVSPSNTIPQGVSAVIEHFRDAVAVRRTSSSSAYRCSLRWYARAICAFQSSSMNRV